MAKSRVQLTQKPKIVTVERKRFIFDFFTNEELFAAKGSFLVFDIECYFNYFLISFKCYTTKRIVYFERYEGVDFNLEKLMWVVLNNCIGGFNSRNYDVPILWLAIAGASPEQLKAATQDIIENNFRTSELLDKYRFKILETNHIDIMEVAPLSASLKLYGGRMHTKRMQDLPYHHDDVLKPNEMVDVREYCFNDLGMTGELFAMLSKQLDLRVKMSKTYGQDLRSKSDAQIAETVITAELKKVLGYWPKRPDVAPGLTFKYKKPDFIKFQTPMLQHVLQTIVDADFVVAESGKVKLPATIAALDIELDNVNYTLQIGGLHSTEKSESHVADEKTILAEVDAASFYPMIILNQKLFPLHLGEGFLTVYGTIVYDRLAAKKTDKPKADSLKIVINGGFGKFGDPYSKLYSPHLLIGVTMTGQLSLLMLIEQLSLVGIPAVSANTDGIILKYPKTEHNRVWKLINEFEAASGYKMEETRYKALYSRDVNNYFAVKHGGGKDDAEFLDDRLGCKVKGSFAERGSALNSVLSKNPEHLICSDAVLQLIVNGVPIIETIKNCKDVKRFVTVRTVKGGALKDGRFLGKAIRWYYSTETTTPIRYKLSGNKVPKSVGAKPLMDLPPTLPTDIDYSWYIHKTNELLLDIDFYHRATKPKQISFF